MPSKVSTFCLLVLQLFFYVQARESPAKFHIRDNFDLPNIDKHRLDFTSRDLHRESQSEIPLNKRRFRRGTVCANPTDIKNIIKDKFKFATDNRHMSFSMTWVGKDFKTILLLATTEFFIFALKRSALFKSDDYGASFKKINTDIFGGHIRKDFGIQRSPVDPDRVILVSFVSLPILARSSRLYITKDGAKTWKKVDLPFHVSNGIEFHPRNKDWIIAKGSTLQQGAYLSTDFGFTWKKLRPYVLSVKWGARQDMYVEREEKTIFLTVALTGSGIVNLFDLTLWRSRNLGKDFKSISKHVYSFGVQGPFLFFTIDLNRNNSTRIMYVSKDGGDTQAVAQVPSIVPSQFYSIMDMSEGMIFLHVDDPLDTGKGVLYTSDADGIVFSKSLDNHVYTKFDAVTDFYKVESMNGTYIANRMNTDNSLTTVITHDRGGEWHTIKLDESLCKGQTALKESSVCTLHIHGKFSLSRHINDVGMGPISESTAVGVIIAHANPGYALLSKNIGIWISRDGGYTWKTNDITQTGLRGEHYYAIADHGNLLLAVSASSSTIKSLMYSIDEGACWFEYTFADEPFQLTGLVTAPGSRTMKANLWGYVTGKRWMVYTLNFSQLLKRSCVYNDDPSKSDYTKWIPHANGKNKGCLLGKKVTCLRPKTGVFCFNGEDYLPKSTTEYCPCTRADLECEYGYYREVGQDTCKQDKSKEPELCLHGDVFKPENKGYRRIPGDMCDKSGTTVEKFVDTHEKCKNASKLYSYGVRIEALKKKNSKSVVGSFLHSQPFDKISSNSKLTIIQQDSPRVTYQIVAVIIPIAIVALVIALFFGKKYWDIHKSKPSYQYSTLPQEPTLHDTPDNDIFGDPRPNGGPYNSDDDAAMIQV